METATEISKLIVSVLGGGNGGHAIAADLSLAGFDVNFYEAPEFKEGIAHVIKTGKIELSGVSRQGTARLRKATTDMKEAVEKAEVIHIVTAAFAHEIFYTRLLPHLQDGQTIVTHTGNYGSLELAHMLKTKGVKKDINIAETETLVYACRRIAPGKVNVVGLKDNVLFSALPATKTNKTLQVMRRQFPQLIKAKNVLQTSFVNMNYVLHPTITLMNAGRIGARNEKFLFYVEGATPSVCRVIEEVDKERMAVEKGLGFEPIPVSAWLTKHYGSKGKDLYEVLQNTKPYYDRATVSAPSSLNYRYITEDIPYGLVPLTYFGDMLHIATPTARALIQTASIINNTNYMRDGLTLEKMGLAGRSIKQIWELVN